jgi:hypothetical protein
MALKRITDEHMLEAIRDVAGDGWRRLREAT